MCGRNIWTSKGEPVSWSETRRRYSSDIEKWPQARSTHDQAERRDIDFYCDRWIDGTIVRPRTLYRLRQEGQWGFVPSARKERPMRKQAKTLRFRAGTERAALERIVKRWRPGDNIPVFEYRARDHKLWTTVMTALAQIVLDRACEEYLAARALFLRDTDFEGVPRLRDLHGRLAAMSGFGFAPTTGLSSHRAFFGALGHGLLPANIHLRTRNPFFSEFPDLLHEVVGHGAALADRQLAELYRLIGRVGATLDDPAMITCLARVFFHGLEMGVVFENGRPKAVGAAILSSLEELSRIERTELRPFDPYAMMLQPVDDSVVQPHYYAAPSFEALLNILAEFVLRLLRRSGLGVLVPAAEPLP